MACQLVCKSAKKTCTDDAASRWQVAVSCLSQLTATQLMETCIACRMHAQLHSEMQFLKVTTFVPNFFPSLSYAGRETKFSNVPTALTCSTHLEQQFPLCLHPLPHRLLAQISFSDPWWSPVVAPLSFSIIILKGDSKRLHRK